MSLKLAAQKEHFLGPKIWAQIKFRDYCVKENFKWPKNKNKSDVIFNFVPHYFLSFLSNFFVHLFLK